MFYYSIFFFSLTFHFRNLRKTIYASCFLLFTSQVSLITFYFSFANCHFHFFFSSKVRNKKCFILHFFLHVSKISLKISTFLTSLFSLRTFQFSLFFSFLSCHFRHLTSYFLCEVRNKKYFILQFSLHILHFSLPISIFSLFSLLAIWGRKINTSYFSLYTNNFFCLIP